MTIFTYLFFHSTLHLTHTFKCNDIDFYLFIYCFRKWKHQTCTVFECRFDGGLIKSLFLLQANMTPPPSHYSGSSASSDTSSLHSATSRHSSQVSTARSSARGSSARGSSARSTKSLSLSVQGLEVAGL